MHVKYTVYLDAWRELLAPDLVHIWGQQKGLIASLFNEYKVLFLTASHFLH